MQARDYGTAMHSVPNVIRSKEWLEENGQCLDNIRPGSSTIKQAGRGAFATRTLKQGAVISPAPLLHIHRDSLVMCGSQTKQYVQCEFEQLFLNYCFGHRDSSLLLYPYAPAVNFINHKSESPNAYIRWSDRSHHHADWENRTVEDILSEPYAGLALEFVALRDISGGEEVFIDYGRGWEEAWNGHVEEWEAGPYDANYVPPSEFYKDLVVHTAVEQKSSPYPWNIMTTCFVAEYGDEYTGPYGRQHRWVQTPSLFVYSYDEHECKVLLRERLDEYRSSSIRPLQNDLYTAQVMMYGKRLIISHIPRQAIGFVDRRYHSDQFITNAFRHEIDIPDDIFPTAWKDQEE